MAIEREFTPKEGNWLAILNTSHIGFFRIVEEFLDNCVSAGARTICICLEQVKADAFCLRVEDDGKGICEEDLSEVFAVGHTNTNREHGRHNQYGTGLKSAIASCDDTCENWMLASCTADRPEEYLRVSDPFCQKRVGYAVCDRTQEPWPGQMSGKQGTYISVPLSRTLFQSSDLHAKEDKEHIQALVEELGVTYAAWLDGGKMTLCWKLLNGEGGIVTIKRINPVWSGGMLEGTERVTFSRGELEIRYKLGRVEAHPETHKYYCKNTESSGLMIFHEGRLIEYNLFSDIWKKQHNDHNAFLFQVDLRAVEGNLDALPRPTPAKDHMVQGDPCYVELTEWVRKICPNPRKAFPRVGKVRERDLCQQLKERLRASGATCTYLELPALMEGGRKAPRTDLYARMPDGRAVLYEAKLNRSSWQNLSQLTDYFMMAAENGPVMDELVLVAKSHPKSVYDHRVQKLKRWYRNLKIPEIRLITWDEVEKGAL